MIRAQNKDRKELERATMHDLANPIESYWHRKMTLPTTLGARALAGCTQRYIEYVSYSFCVQHFTCIAHNYFFFFFFFVFLSSIQRLCNLIKRQLFPLVRILSFWCCNYALTTNAFLSFNHAMNRTPRGLLSPSFLSLEYFDDVSHAFSFLMSLERTACLSGF